MISPRYATSGSPKMASDYTGRAVRHSIKQRICAGPDCAVRLSRYNFDSLCGGCRGQVRRGTLTMEEER